MSLLCPVEIAAFPCTLRLRGSGVTGPAAALEALRNPAVTGVSEQGIPGIPSQDCGGRAPSPGGGYPAAEWLLPS